MKPISLTKTMPWLLGASVVFALAFSQNVSAQNSSNQATSIKQAQTPELNSTNFANFRINYLNNKIKAKMGENNKMLLPENDGLLIGHQNVNAYFFTYPAFTQIWYSQGLPKPLNDSSLGKAKAYAVFGRKAFNNNEFPDLQVNYEPESRFTNWPTKEAGSGIKVFYSSGQYVIYKDNWEVSINASSEDHNPLQRIPAKVLTSQVAAFLKTHNLPQTTGHGRIDLSTSGHISAGRKPIQNEDGTTFKSHIIWQDDQNTQVKNNVYQLDAQDPLASLRMLTSLK